MIVAAMLLMFLASPVVDAAAASPAGPPKDSYACPTEICDSGYQTQAVRCCAPCVALLGETRALCHASLSTKLKSDVVTSGFFNGAKLCVPSRAALAAVFAAPPPPLLAARRRRRA